MNYTFGVNGYVPTFSDAPVDTIIFTVPGEPMSKQRPRFNTKSGRAYTPAQTRNVEKLIAETYVATGHGHFVGNISVEIAFYMGTKRRKDLDNLVKTVLDALNGVAYIDDHMVHLMSAVKFFSTPDKARTEIRISQIDSTFDERSQ